METMTISQALRHAKKLKGRISDARDRAQKAVTHPADEKPAFDFRATMERADSLSDELAELEGRLALANAREFVDFRGRSMSLCHAVRALQELRGRIAWVKTLAVQATSEYSVTDSEWSDEHERTVRRRVDWKCHLPEAERARLADDLQDRFDELNALVERRNQEAPLVPLGDS